MFCFLCACSSVLASHPSFARAIVAKTREINGTFGSMSIQTGCDLHGQFGILHSLSRHFWLTPWFAVNSALTWGKDASRNEAYNH